MAKNQKSLLKFDLVVMAVTPAYAPTNDPGAPLSLETVRKVLNPANIIGLSAPSLIWTNGIENKGVLILAISSDEMTLGIAAKDSLSVMPLQEYGLKLARDLTSSLTASERHGAIIFCDTPALNHSPILLGMQEGLGRAFTIAGAINPGGLFFQNRLLSDAIGGIIFSGKMTFAAGLDHGWQPLGKPRIIDDSDGNLIRTINGKPAASIYQEYFPDDFPSLASLPAGKLRDIGLLYPLGLGARHPKGYINKSPSGMLPDNSLICQGNIPRGSPVHLMIGDKDSCRQASQQTAMAVRDKMGGKNPKLVLIFASLSRRKLFGRSAIQEINRIKEILGLACPVFGMYTHGEFGAATPMDLQTHNASIQIVAIG